MKFLRDESGQALVETAVTAPLFLLLLAGAMELGRVAHYAIEVQNAARAGAAYGSVNIGNAGNTTNIGYAAANDAPDIANLSVSSSWGCVCETYAYSTGTSSFSPSAGIVQAVVNGVPGNCSPGTSNSTVAACTADNSTESQSVVSYVTVSTSETITPLFHNVGLGPYTVTGYSALRILSN